MAGHHYYSRQEKKEFVLKRLGILLLVTIGLVTMFTVTWKVLSRNTPRRAVEATTEHDIITVDGKRYEPKRNLRTYLLIGCDTKGVREDVSQNGGKPPMADTIQLLVCDRDEKTYYRIPINRNTICDVNSLDSEGNVVATSKLQLSYAHASGGGMENSAKNTADSVSGLLGGVPIKEYASLNMDAIGVLNHMAGGVTITVPEDLTKSDPALVKGTTLTLTDEQAEHFVRARMSVTDGTNESRMSRQEIFLAAMKDRYREKFREDEKFAADVYHALEPYMVTSISVGDASRLAKSLMDSEDMGRMEIEGTVGEDEYGYATFEADQDSINQVLTTVFYQEVEKDEDY